MDLRVAAISVFWSTPAPAGFVLVTTDSDFERLLSRFSGANVVILSSCNYPTEVAGDVLRRNAIRIAQLPGSHDRLIGLER
jgi:predicted nuclease of predicted toxin-antitoxin system